MRFGVRTRFALLAALLVLVVGSLVALGGYVTLRRSLLGQAEREAGDQANQLAALIDVPGVQPAADGPQNVVDLDDPSLSRDFVRGGLLVQVTRPDGTRVQGSRGAPRLDGDGLRAACLRSGQATGRLHDPAGFVACRRAGSAATPVGLVTVAAPLGADLTSLARLRNALIGGLVLGVLLAAVAALGLARRALRPARTMAETAETIRSGDLSERIGYRGPRDELGALAEVLDECFAELEQAVDRQRRFVADASHELKTPIAVIRAHTELLGGWAATDPDARRIALASLDQAARRMGRLVGDLLYLTELDREPPHAHVPVELDRQLLTVVAEAGPLRPEVPIRVERLDEAVVAGDAVHLQALLLNLIDNALRASPPGAEVAVALEAGGETCSVTVTDRGQGIPPDALERVFDRFYRAGKRDGATGGTGLGLAIAREIARAHGGDLTASNGPGGGAALRLSIPCESASANLHPAITELLSDRHSVAPDGSPTGGT